MQCLSPSSWVALTPHARCDQTSRTRRIAHPRASSSSTHRRNRSRPRPTRVSPRIKTSPVSIVATISLAAGCILLKVPAGSLFTGLAWFSCKAEGAQYPINQTAMVPYPTLVAQQLRRACKCDTFSQLCARALLTEKASAFQTMLRFHSRTGTLGSCSHRCSRAASRRTRSWCCTRACSVPSCLPPLSVVAVAWLLADGRVWIGTMATSWASATSGARKPASTSRRTSL